MSVKAELRTYPAGYWLVCCAAGSGSLWLLEQSSGARPLEEKGR